MSEHLDASYRWCKQLSRQSGSSFCWSFGLLERDASLGMHALYAFARITDDLADGSESIEQKRRNLLAWRQQLKRLNESEADTFVLDSKFPDALTRYNALWPALQDTVAKFHLPVSLLDEIVHGVSLDIEQQQPVDWAELKDYCYHVASTVGLACTHIWQASNTMPRQVAIDCGIAFQLTNILRDVATDAQQGRIYIPHCEFERFNVSPVLWLQGNPDGDWSGLIQSVAARAELLYCTGWETMQFLPPPGQRVFSLMWRYYHELLNQVCRSREQLWKHKRLRISTVARARLAAQHFISPLYRTLSSPTI